MGQAIGDILPMAVGVAMIGDAIAGF